MFEEQEEMFEEQAKASRRDEGEVQDFRSEKSSVTAVAAAAGTAAARAMAAATAEDSICSVSSRTVLRVEGDSALVEGSKMNYYKAVRYQLARNRIYLPPSKGACGFLLQVMPLMRNVSQRLPPLLQMDNVNSSDIFVWALFAGHFDLAKVLWRSFCMDKVAMLSQAAHL